MRALLMFLQRFGTTLLFLVLEITALVLLCTRNDFQRSVVFSSASRLSGQLYEVQYSVNRYFHLKDTNRALWIRNGELEKRIATLEASLREHELPEQNLKESDEFSFIYGQIIKKDVSSPDNYMTLNIGSNDGVEERMGVCGVEGIVGIVVRCTPHYSLVASVLNSKMSFSCKVAGTQAVGSLSWDGRDTHYAYLEEMPGFIQWQAGDTVVTSGYSNTFPEGVPVGVIESYDKKSAENIYSAKVRLFTHFESISEERILRMRFRDELMELEKEVNP